MWPVLVEFRSASSTEDLTKKEVEDRIAVKRKYADDYVWRPNDVIVTLCIWAFEREHYRKSMRISYTEHVTNEEVLKRVEQNHVLLRRVRHRKLKYSNHIL